MHKKETAQFVSLGNNSLVFYEYRITYRNINSVFSLVALNRIDSTKWYLEVFGVKRIPLLVFAPLGEAGPPNRMC